MTLKYVVGGGIVLKGEVIQKNIKTSIIIPIYNTERYLETCIESALTQIQTQREIEIILVDDGSTDGSRHIIEKYEESYPCVKAVFQENQKLGAARNAGVEVASGKYLYFLDSDDYIQEGLLEKCYQTVEKGNLDFVMFDAVTFVEEEETARFREGSADEEYNRSSIGIEDRVYTGMEFWEKFYSNRGIYSNAYLVYINADFFRKNGLFFEPGVFYEDMDWIIRLYICAERIAYIPQKLYFRRIHVGSIMTVNYNVKHVKSSIFMCRKITQLFLDEESAARQNMIQSILESMIGRFKDIFKVYCDGQRLMDICLEIMEFYDYLLLVYEDILAKNWKLGFNLLITLETIKAGMHDIGVKADALDLKLEQHKARLIFGELQGFPLEREGQVVGIYGTGLVCDRFLFLYRKYVGEISASIFFIDTYQKSNKTYQGYPLYNIADAADRRIDTIIIASNCHKESMLDNVKRYFQERMKVQFVPENVSIMYRIVADKLESEQGE